MGAPDGWLVSADGVRSPVGLGGLLIGRRADCDLVLGDGSVSRLHALVRQGPDGPELVPLGRGSTLRDGEPLQDPTPLKPGDRLVLGNTELRYESPGGGAGRARSWLLRSASGLAAGVTRTPFVVGGEPTDDLFIDGWPAAAARLRDCGELLEVELAAPGTVAGRACEAGELTSLGPGDALEFDGLVITAQRVGVGDEASTVLPLRLQQPLGIELRFLESGGLLRLRFEGGWCSVWLSNRRCDLVAALLQPLAGEAGDFVGDDEAARRVWPGETSKDRAAINLLLYRLRRTLIEAGLDGKALLDRAPGGGATRFVLSPGVRVAVD